MKAKKNLRKLISKDWYQEIKIDPTKKAPELTEKEFKEGKQGIVWMDTITGKLVFKKIK